MRVGCTRKLQRCPFYRGALYVDSVVSLGSKQLLDYDECPYFV